MERAKFTNGTIVLVSFFMAGGLSESALGQACAVFEFSFPAILNGNANSDTTLGHDNQPKIATNGQGTWIAVWQSAENDLDGSGGPLAPIGSDLDIVYARSLDYGVTWSLPLPLNSTAGTDGTRSDQFPQITTDGSGRWTVVWQSHNLAGGPMGTDKDILFSVSSDDGASWTPPAALNSNALTPGEGDDETPQIVTNGQGKWVAVWQSTTNVDGIGDYDIHYSWTSNITGASPWAAPAPLNTNADDDGGYDVNPHLTEDGRGNWVAVWTSSENLGGAIGFDPDILYSRGRDDGQSGLIWNAPEPLDDHASIDVSAQDLYPQIATDGDGNWAVIWHSNRHAVNPSGNTGDWDIMISESTLVIDPEDEFSWSPGGPLHQATARDDTGEDQYAQIITDGNGIWSAVWQFQPGGLSGFDLEIAYSTKTDGGNWKAPAKLNTNSGSDRGRDERPHIATDGFGNSVVVWHSDDARNGVSTADFDILFARFSDCNQNELDDACDISSQLSNDCDDNGVPDECQADCDGDEIPDVCELAPAGTSQDCNANTIPDECDIADCPTGQTSCTNCSDFDENGVPDGCEGDTDSDGAFDPCDNCPTISNANQQDCNQDGEGDACENESDEQDTDSFGGPDGVCNGVDNCPNHANAAQVDNDLDGVGNACDNCPAVQNPGQENCDGDLFGDACDSPGHQSADGDTVCDNVDNCTDVANQGQEDGDGDNVGDACDNCPNQQNTNQWDCDDDGIGDVCALESGGGTSLDCNGNGVPDECEIDENSPAPGQYYCNPASPPDGTTGCAPDCNDNGIPDSCDIDSGFSSDCDIANGNFVPDECELAAGDCNSNGVADSCDIARCTGSPDCSDCQDNGVPDACDIGTVSEDADANGVPDECEFGPPRVAPYPHRRRVNRYIAFDPNKTANDNRAVAFKIELKDLTLGSCSGNGGFCREDRGGEDCNVCSSVGNPCIHGAIDCAPSPPQTCDTTGQLCINDAPDVGGTNVGRSWWVGPESPLGNGVHLLVSESFRKISDDWPNPTYVGDCEIVPQAQYGVRAVSTTTDPEDIEGESDEVQVETARYAATSASWWGDAVGPLKKFCGGDIRGKCNGTGLLCSADAECPAGQFCIPGRCGGNGAVCQFDSDCIAPVVCQFSNGCTDNTQCTAPATCKLAWTLPDGAANFDDISAVMALVAPGPASTAPLLTWVDLHGNNSNVSGSESYDPPNYVPNFSDVQQMTLAFQGRPYAFRDPADCPDLGCWPSVCRNCGNGTVNLPEECDGGLGCLECTCTFGFVPADTPSLDCLPLGACCAAGNCAQDTEDTCTAGGGIYLGDGAACVPGACP